MAGGSESGLQLGKSLGDPWSYAGCVPDGARGVGCFTIKQTATLTTGTLGTCYGAAMQMSPDSFNVIDSGSVVSTFTPGGSWVLPSANVTINNLYGKVRPVSGGIRVIYTGNTINDQGTLLLGQLSGDVPLSVLSGANLASISNACQFYRTYPLRSGGIITWRPDEMDDIASFIDTFGVAVGTTIKPATPYLVAIAFGAAPSGTSTCIIEFIAQFQGQYIVQNFMPGGPESSLLDATRSAEPGWYEHAKNFVNLIEPIVPYVKATASNLLMNAASAYLPTSRSMRSFGARQQRFLEL